MILGEDQQLPRYIAQQVYPGIIFASEVQGPSGGGLRQRELKTIDRGIVCLLRS